MGACCGLHVACTACWPALAELSRAPSASSSPYSPACQPHLPGSPLQLSHLARGTQTLQRPDCVIKIAGGAWEGQHVGQRGESTRTWVLRSERGRPPLGPW